MWLFQISFSRRSATRANIIVAGNVVISATPETSREQCGVCRNRAVTIATAASADASVNHVTAVAPPVSTPNLLDIIVAQNTSFSKGFPARPYGMPPNWNQYAGRWAYMSATEGWSAIAAWNIVYPIDGSQKAPAGKLETRNHRCWVHLRSGGWQLVQEVGNGFQIEGGMFVATMDDNVATPGVIEHTATGALMPLPSPGQCWHWWPGPRGTFDPEKVDWCYHQEDMRLTDAADKFCVEVGADWWASASAQYPNNPLAGNSNWIALTTAWQTVGFYSCTEAQLRADPPPGLV